MTRQRELLLTKDENVLSASVIAINQYNLIHTLSGTDPTARLLWISLYAQPSRPPGLRQPIAHFRIHIYA